MKNFFQLLSQINTIAVISIVALFIILCIVYRKAITWYLKELIAMYSAGETFFSKKRIESGIAFLFALIVTIYYVYQKIDIMDIWQFGYIMTTWLFIAGYTVNQIQKEKASTPDEPKA